MSDLTSVVNSEKPSNFTIDDTKDIEFEKGKINKVVFLSSQPINTDGFVHIDKAPQIWIYENDGSGYKKLASFAPSIQVSGEGDAGFYLSYESSSPFFISTSFDNQGILVRYTVANTADSWGIFPLIVKKNGDNFAFSNVFPNTLLDKGNQSDNGIVFSKIYDFENSKDSIQSAGIEDYFIRGDSMIAVFRQTLNCRACPNKSIVDIYRSTENGIIYDDRVKNHFILNAGVDPKVYIENLPLTSR